MICSRIVMMIMMGLLFFDGFVPILDEDGEVRICDDESASGY